MLPVPLPSLPLEVYCKSCTQLDDLSSPIDDIESEARHPLFQCYSYSKESKVQSILTQFFNLNLIYWQKRFLLNHFIYFIINVSNTHNKEYIVTKIVRQNSLKHVKCNVGPRAHETKKEMIKERWRQTDKEVYLTCPMYEAFRQLDHSYTK